MQPCRVAKELPHDPNAFTQGLVFADGLLYESVGGYGVSELRAVEVATGRILRRRRLPPSLFAEGLTLVNDLLVQLTWRGKTGFFYDRKRFAIRRTFVYDHQGWGAAWDGSLLHLSDGSAVIRRYDAQTFQERGRIEVRDRGRPVTRLNELEFVGQELWANVWQSSRIARIDPASGVVRGWLDCSELAQKTAPPHDRDAVLNGIAWDPATGRVFITGKRWPRIFVLAFP